MGHTCRLPEAVTDCSGKYDLIISSGGAAAVLGGTGAAVACQLAGLDKFRRIGGVSGGSVVAAMTAVGLPSSELLRLTIETSFKDYLNLATGMLWLFGLGRRGRARQEESQGDEHVERYYTGLFGTERLGNFVENKILAADPERKLARPGAVGNYWPANFWTMATTKNGAQVVLDADGVTLIELDGSRQILSDTPARISTAIRASCTIPGIMAALDYKGVRLFDGALSRDGICPAGLQIRHFGAEAQRIIACRIGEDLHRPISGRLHSLARWLWWVDPEFHWGPETAGVIECRPHIDHVHTLKFHLSDDEKWLAILQGFEMTLSQLALHGILKGTFLQKAQSVLGCLGFWRDAIPAAAGSRQVLAERAQSCFAEHGLF